MPRNSKVGDPDGLTPLQRRFVTEYMVDLVGSLAVTRAGFRTKWPDKVASQLIGKPSVHKVITRMMAARAKKLDIKADYVLKELYEEHQRLKTLNTTDMSLIVNKDGSLKPIDQWPPILRQRQSIRSLKIHELYEMDNKTRKKVLAGRIKDVVQADLKSIEKQLLELIGRHTNVGAFKDTPLIPGEIKIIVEYAAPDAVTGDTEEEPESDEE